MAVLLEISSEPTNILRYQDGRRAVTLTSETSVEAKLGIWLPRREKELVLGIVRQFAGGTE